MKLFFGLIALLSIAFFMGAQSMPYPGSAFVTIVSPYSLAQWSGYTTTTASTTISVVLCGLGGVSNGSTCTTGTPTPPAVGDFVIVGLVYNGTVILSGITCSNNASSNSVNLLVNGNSAANSRISEWTWPASSYLVTTQGGGNTALQLATYTCSYSGTARIAAIVVGDYKNFVLVPGGNISSGISSATAPNGTAPPATLTPTTTLGSSPWLVGIIGTEAAKNLASCPGSSCSGYTGGSTKLEGQVTCSSNCAVGLIDSGGITTASGIGAGWTGSIAYSILGVEIDQ